MANRELTITTANSRRATVWVGSRVRISDFAARLGATVRSTETFDAYLKMPKAQQDELKDVGGYVGGAFSGTKRKANELVSRSMITLDLDNIPSGMTDDVLRRVDSLGYCATVYSTRKHAPWQPRLRVVFYLDTDCTAEEYGAIARKTAWFMLGDQMAWCDPTTFEASRLMYYPSTSSDGEFVYRHFDKEGLLPKDGMLATYADWHDVTAWPTVPGHEAVNKTQLVKAGDPAEKKGVVGAFCKTYTVEDAMAVFLPGIYTPTETPGRYSYSAASTTGGAVVYEDGKFLFSHHASDPICNQLVNAFDLVRIHKYGDLDDEAKPGTPFTALPSFKAMATEAMNVPEIKKDVLANAMPTAEEAFGETDNNDWLLELEVGKGGIAEKTTNNILLIMRNDKQIENKIVTDVFAGVGMVTGPVPWNDSREIARRWTDADDAGLRWYLEHNYRICAREKTYDALAIIGREHEVNRVKEYLDSLIWDGVKRIDTLLIDYLGAEDNVYTRAVMRKTMVAACARGIKGGVKFDTMPILVGPQGVGKSTFVGCLGKDWFTDSLTSFEGKDAAELIQGMWIVEVGELSALWNREVNAIKQFLSKTKDDYRGAYERRSTEHPRRCVFIGTTNSEEFLRDVTGNRRFWPVELMMQPPTKSVFRDLEAERDQLWAEAYVRYRLGLEPLYLNPSENELAEEAQRRHQMDDGSRGQIEDFLDQPIPPNWYDLDLASQKSFINGNSVLEATDLVPRERVCAREIYDILMGGDGRRYDRREISRINAIMANMPGWVKDRVPYKFGGWRSQRGFHKERGC